MQTNLWLQLGIAGATLLILYVFIQKLFSLFEKYSNTLSKSNLKEDEAQDSAIVRLIEKIDTLIQSYSAYQIKLNEVLIKSENENKSTTEVLNRVLDSLLDTQRRVVRIDDRTYKCLGNDVHKEESEK